MSDSSASGCGCLLVLVFGAAVFLFVPRYDLEIATAPGPSNYEIVEEGFWTLKGVRKAREQYVVYDWSAMEWTYWGRWVSYKNSRWGKRVR